MQAVTCTVCLLPFMWWQRVTDGQRHGACNADLLDEEREVLYAPIRAAEQAQGQLW